MWFLIGLLGGLVIGCLATLLAILHYTVPRLERLFVFRPARDVLRKPIDLGVAFDQCFIDTPDGCRLHGWHLCPPSPIASVLYFHGATGNLGILNELLVMLYNHGLQVLAVDYRGYGWSTGVPSEQGLYRDALATVAYFEANFRRPSQPVVYWGRSLGGSVAAFAAGKVPPSGLVLETAFPSQASLLDEFPQFRLFRHFSRNSFDTVAHLSDQTFPVLVVHGDRDKTVPLRQGQLLFTKLNGPKEFWRVEGAGHLDIHMIDSESYMQRILGFIASLQPTLVH